MASEKRFTLQAKSGTEDFKTFIDKGYYYVDKTQYLKPIFEAADAPLLILRPRRFGKTLMMSTLRYFLEMDYDNPTDTSKPRKLFNPKVDNNASRNGRRGGFGLRSETG